MKKAISLGVAAAMAATLLAGCGTAASSAPAASSEAASTADSTAASSEVTASETHEINTTDPIELTISWWGGDSRHEAYQKALEAFHEISAPSVASRMRSPDTIAIVLFFFMLDIG